MKRISSEQRKWLVVAVYAVAMAWVEAAVVYYLRTMVNRIEPYQPNPLPIATGLGEAELVREAATLIMLLAVGWLAGSTARARAGYSLLAFGIWDIFYYVFLRTLTGRPTALTDWDILFLIPLPWWGPVWAPVAIALLMILWGTLVTQFEPVRSSPGPNWKHLGFVAFGVVLALYVFMADAIQVRDQGVSALRNVLPLWFNWPLFVVALALLALPVIDAAFRAARSRRRIAGDLTTTDESS